MKKSRGEKLLTAISITYVAAAICFLTAVSCRCYPQLGELGRRFFVGNEDSPAREAFSALTNSLEQGNSLKDSVAISYEALFGEED